MHLHGTRAHSTGGNLEDSHTSMLGFANTYGTPNSLHNTRDRTVHSPSHAKEDTPEDKIKSPGRPHDLTGIPTALSDTI